MARRPRVGRRSADGAWKRVLTDLLPDFLAFAVPELYDAVDWDTPAISLDKEFQSLSRQAALKQRAADLVVQLRLRAGADAWLVLHVEAQGEVQPDFSARMFTYYALVHLRLWRQRQRGAGQQQEPMPLILGAALLTDERADWHPGSYVAQGFGRGVGYDFWVVKLLDWRGRESELVASDNPFALIAHTWLQLQAGRNREATGVAVVRAALRAMIRRGYDNERAAAVLAFLDHVVVLSPGRFDALLDEAITAEGVAMAQVMSRYEREGMRKGRLEGRQEERREIAMRLLTNKLGPLNESTVAKIQALDSAQLLGLLDALLSFTGHADLGDWLAAQGA